MSESTWCEALSRGARIEREARGLTVAEAARRAGVEYRTVRRFELYCGQMRYPTLVKLVDVYGGSADRLARLGGYREPPPSPDEGEVLRDCARYLTGAAARLGIPGQSLGLGLERSAERLLRLAARLDEREAR